MGIGEANEVPQQVIAFKELYFGENVKDYFLRLENEGTDAGKLYALCGLYYLDKRTFDRLTKKHQHNTILIPGFEGCFSTITPMNQIISAANPDQMDIKHGKIPQALLDYIS